MIPVDLHTHSLFSGCGLHTVLELLTAAKEKGLQGIAITDHGRFVGGKTNSVFYERFVNPVPGIRLLKGIETNPNEDGFTDIPRLFIEKLDVVLLGLHDNLPKDKSALYNTTLLIKTMEHNRCIDIITHANNPLFPLEYGPLCEAAKALGVAIEFNDSKVRYQRTGNDDTERLIVACQKTGCRTVINSDAHSVHEIGSDDYIRPLLIKHQFPDASIINATPETAFVFLEERRIYKTAQYLKRSE